MEPRILVTGATGTVGNETVKALSSMGAHVRAGIHSVVKGENLKRLPSVEVVEIDFSRPITLEAAFTGIDSAFLITPFDEHQVEMAKQLIDAAQKAGVRHIVRLSASGAEAEPGIQLGRWHREVEKYLEAAEVNYTHLRPTSFMQNFSKMYAHTIHQQNAFYLPLGQGRVTYIDARDIGAVAAEILLRPEGHDGMAYTLTGPEALSGEEVAAALSKATGRTISYVDVPEEGARQAMQQQGLPTWMIDSLLELNGICRANYASGTTNTVQEIIGRPPHTFESFAQAYKECF